LPVDITVLAPLLAIDSPVPATVSPTDVASPTTGATAANGAPISDVRGDLAAGGAPTAGVVVAFEVVPLDVVAYVVVAAVVCFLMMSINTNKATTAISAIFISNAPFQSWPQPLALTSPPQGVVAAPLGSSLEPPPSRSDSWA
jgi:hypothetical protein